MRQEIPQHILEQLRALIAEGKSAMEIAFMMRLDQELIRDEIARAHTADRPLELPSK